MTSKIDLEAYLTFPEKLRDTMAHLDDNAMKTPISKDKWTKYQIFLHIIDSDIVYFERIKRVLTEDEPKLPGWNQAPWVALEAQKIDIESNLKVIQAIRQKLYLILSSIGSDDWERYGVHQKYGKLTLNEFVIRQINHSEGHLNSIK